MNKYISKYSNGKSVSAAQYITEIICEKKAKKDKKDLHYRFWLNKEWSAFYRNQIATANKLLQKYNDIAIVKALNNPKSEKIFSLRAPHLPPIIDEEQQSLDSQNKKLSISLNRPDHVVYKQESKNNSIISKLRNLE